MNSFIKIPLKKKKYDFDRIYGKDKLIIILLATSICSSICLFLIGLLTFLGISGISEGFITGFDFFVFGILAIIGPIGFYNHIKSKKKKQIEDQLPDFLREISSSTASGMTIFDAIRSAAKGDHGKLTPELQQMSAQLSWGISVKDALDNFAKRINTDSVKRMAITVNKALEIGGNTSAVFNSAAKEMDQAKNVENQRKAEMSLYSIVIFISFFVFLAVILIIDKTIFQAIFDLQPQMASSGSSTIGGSNLQIADIDHNLLRYTFFSFVLVQSIGGGLLGGFMMDGRLSSGVRYGFILVFVSFFVFKFLF